MLQCRLEIGYSLSIASSLIASSLISKGSSSPSSYIGVVNGDNTRVTAALPAKDTIVVSKRALPINSASAAAQLTCRGRGRRPIACSRKLSTGVTFANGTAGMALLAFCCGGGGGGGGGGKRRRRERKNLLVMETQERI
jgi:hypothetical protein